MSAMSSIPVSKPTELSQAEKLRAALDLAEAGIAMRRAQLERENPNSSSDEIDALLIEWLHHRPGAELGDGVGRHAPDRFESS